MRRWRTDDNQKVGALRRGSSRLALRSLRVETCEVWFLRKAIAREAVIPLRLFNKR